MKLIGGIGCWLHVADQGESARPFRRTYGDIDLVVRSGRRDAIDAILRAEGFLPVNSFNAVQGETRLMYVEIDAAGAPVRTIDVFVERFKMCHEVMLDPEAWEYPEHPSLGLEHLLLTKLQVVRISEKDLNDGASLIALHELGEGSERINPHVMVRHLARDWGLWRTVTRNLEKLVLWSESALDSDNLVVRIRERTTQLLQEVARAPKSLGWRLRNLVGERVAWYDEPEEPVKEWVPVR